MTEEREGQEAGNVRVMTDHERESYDGVTLEQGPGGETYEADDAGATSDRSYSATGPHVVFERSSGDGPHITFERMDAKGLRNTVLEHLLGRWWKWKLGAGIAGAVIVICALVFLASSLLIFALPAIVIVFAVCLLAQMLRR